MTERKAPYLQLVLPDDSGAIEIELPEHFGARSTTSSREKTLFANHLEEFSKPTWSKTPNSLLMEMALPDNVGMECRITAQHTGLTFRYTIANNSDVAFDYLQPVTCVKLQRGLHDLFLERTYVHHADGFELLHGRCRHRLPRTTQRCSRTCRSRFILRWFRESPKSSQNLLDLVGFCRSSAYFLQIHTRFSWPWSLEDVVPA